MGIINVQRPGPKKRPRTGAQRNGRPHILTTGDFPSHTLAALRKRIGKDTAVDLKVRE